MKIPLTRGYSAHVDASDWALVRKYKWHAVPTKGLVYARTKTTYLHRLLLNAPPGKDVDHINGNGLDNRRSNLRVSTHGANLRNAKLNIRNTSGVKGVSWRADQPSWRLQFHVGGKRVVSRCFKTREEAAQEYRRLDNFYRSKGL